MVGYFSSEIGPSTLFAAYKTIKNMEKQGMKHFVKCFFCFLTLLLV